MKANKTKANKRLHFISFNKTKANVRLHFIYLKTKTSARFRFISINKTWKHSATLPFMC